MISFRNLGVALAISTLTLATHPAIAQQRPHASKPVFYGHWMHPDVGQAWGKGFYGQGANVTVIDDFRSGYRAPGLLRDRIVSQTHGGWTSEQISLVAPRANIRKIDYYSTAVPKLAAGLNIVNLSYAIKYDITQGGPNDAFEAFHWMEGKEKRVVLYARHGKAVVVKAAGNDAEPVYVPYVWDQDALNLALVGLRSAIFVGALSNHGSTKSGKKASLASYSNFAGAEAAVNSRFVVVGVREDKTGLGGTSFAAPVVSGYAAILHSKFKRASPTQITNQILKTARKDTIEDYKLHIHGQGEASLSRALSPTSIR